MTHVEQKRFIRELCDNVKKSLLERVKDHPTAWNGIQLRRLIAKRFRMAVIGDLTTRQEREFENDLIVKNIL